VTVGAGQSTGTGCGG